MNKYSEHSKANKERHKTYAKIHGKNGLRHCLKKRGHKTKEDALSFAEGFDTLMRAYFCKHCLNWHLTKLKKG